MNKLILTLSVFLLTQAGNASIADEYPHPPAKDTLEVNVMAPRISLLEQQRREILQEMRHSIRSSLVLKQAPTATISSFPAIQSSFLTKQR